MENKELLRLVRRLRPADRCLLLIALNEFNLELWGHGSAVGGPLGNFRYVGHPRSGLANRCPCVREDTVRTLVGAGRIRSLKAVPGTLRFSISSSGRRVAKRWLGELRDRAGEATHNKPAPVR